MLSLWLYGQRSTTKAGEGREKKRKAAYLPCAVLLVCGTLRVPPGAANHQAALKHMKTTINRLLAVNPVLAEQLIWILFIAFQRC